MSNDLNPHDVQDAETAEILARIGQLTRALREGMRELGLDKQVALAAEAIPDARDRLKYIASMTERAAERALNAVELAQPLQEKLAGDAKSLDRRWSDWCASASPLDAADPLVADTRAYLAAVPRQAGATNAQLMEIMMAQDFQDLTGQVIMKMMEVINEVESHLLQVLIDHVPRAQLAELSSSLQNGPQIKPQSTGVSSQAEADDLLASLGF